MNLITVIRDTFRFGVRTVPLFLVLLLLLSDTATVELYAKTFDLPSRLGTVQDLYESNSAMPTAGRTIIHIQDAHCNYEAQKNMSRILDYFAREHGLKLILVEGGSGDVGLSSLRAYADKKTREEVADRYLKEGKISGEEYLDIISELPLELYGIESQKLYDDHLDTFQKVDSFRQKGLQDLDTLSEIVNDLKLRIYNPELLKLEEKRVGYEAKAVPLAEYCRYLAAAAGRKGLNIRDYPNIAAFSVTAGIEEKLDLQKAESQRNAFIKELAGVLDERGAKGLILMTQGFNAKMVTPEKYYSFLESSGGRRINLKRKYPQLDAYIRYVTASKDVNAAGLLKELNAIEEDIKALLLTGPEEKKLSEIDKTMRILTKILNLELPPEDYAYFKANTTGFNTASWINFLNQECNKYNLRPRPAASRIIDENSAELERFYQLGVAREEAFIKNVEDKIKDSGEKTIALIAGGFHTPGITRMLKDRNYSYMVVTPAITEKGDPGLYFSVLRGEKKQDDR